MNLCSLLYLWEYPLNVYVWMNWKKEQLCQISKQRSQAFNPFKKRNTKQKQRTFGTNFFPCAGSWVGWNHINSDVLVKALNRIVVVHVGCNRANWALKYFAQCTCKCHRKLGHSYFIIYKNELRGFNFSLFPHCV